MNNNLEFNLNDEDQFPAINRIVKLAFSGMPEEFDYYDYTLPKTFANNDFNSIVQKVKIFMPDFVVSMSPYFEELMDERDNYFAINIQDKDHREHNINRYNKIAAKKIDIIVRAQYPIIEFTCELNEEQKQELNIKQYFNEWYKQFPYKDETGTNEAPQAAGTNAAPEPMTEFEYKTTAQKIAWLHEIGILETVMNKCKDGETINSRRAANVIHSFTGIDAGTLRKCLGAIYQPATDQKNNPLNNPANKLFVTDMAAKFKLNK